MLRQYHVPVDMIVNTYILKINKKYVMDECSAFKLIILVWQLSGLKKWINSRNNTHWLIILSIPEH